MWQNAEGYCLERVRHVATSSKALGQQSRPAGPSVKPVRPTGSQSLPTRPVGPSIEPVRPPSIPAGPKAGEIRHRYRRLLRPSPPSQTPLAVKCELSVRQTAATAAHFAPPLKALMAIPQGPQGHQAKPARPAGQQPGAVFGAAARVRVPSRSRSSAAARSRTAAAAAAHAGPGGSRHLGGGKARA